MRNANASRRQAVSAMLLVLVMGAIFLLSACGTTTTLYEPHKVSSELLEPCQDLVLAETDGWVTAHARNVQAYVDCRTRYDALREAVRHEDH